MYEKMRQQIYGSMDRTSKLAEIAWLVTVCKKCRHIPARMQELMQTLSIRQANMSMNVVVEKGCAQYRKTP